MESEIVKVKALCRISENSVIIEPGQVFEVEKARAEALGEVVEIVTGEETAKPKAKDKKK